MKYALTAAMAKEMDKQTVLQTGLPTAVLMERAALAVATKTAELAVQFARPVKIAAVCGYGNNGADGIAAARILSWQGLRVDVILVGEEERATKELIQQKKIADASGIVFEKPDRILSYDLIIDGIFGVGLKRVVGGVFAETVNRINESGAAVVSIDVPSGIDATTGAVLGTAVRAQATVTFGYHKTGLLLYPGREYAGEVTVAEIGFYPEALRGLHPSMYFMPSDLARIPKRKPAANKGDYGRVLVIAGSRDMSGAAYFSAAAAYCCGAGLVEVLTDERNAGVIRTLLPEAIVTGYDEDTASDLLQDRLTKATAAVLGPGLSQSGTAKRLVQTALKYGRIPLIADADALNIAASDPKILSAYQGCLVITPHIGEMCRLTGCAKEEILSDAVKTASDFAKKYRVICVMKNAATVVAEPEGECRTYINRSGTPAMAKGGTGDVLTGMIAGMFCLHLEPFSAAAMGVYVHGLAGEAAAEEKDEHAVLASDLIRTVGGVLRGGLGR